MQRVHKVTLSEILFQINAGMIIRVDFRASENFTFFPTTGEKSSRREKRLNILITNPYSVVPHLKSVA